MPFTSSGVFQRLYNWRNDRDGGVKILAERMDQEMDGIVGGLNDVLQGNAPFKAPIKGVTGTAASPAFTFEEHTGDGFFRKSDGSIGVSIGGAEVGAFPASFFTKIAENHTDTEDHIAATDDPHNIAPQTILNKLKTVDGAGSELNADRLDGQHAAFYRNVDNMTAGTLADERLPDRIRKHSATVTDWNNATESGFYQSGPGASNSPFDGYWVGRVEAHSSQWVTQTIHNFTDNQQADTRTMRRERNDGTWGAWYSLRISEAEQSTIYRNASNLDAGTVPLARLPQGSGQGMNADLVDGQHAGWLAPPSAVSLFLRSSAPPGWLKANGAAVSRTTYGRLFGVIGTGYGHGNGSTTFNLPDLRGEFLRVWDDGRGVDGGRGFASWQGDLVRAHNHAVGHYAGHNPFGSHHFETDPHGYVNRVNDGVRRGSASTSWYGGNETRPRNVALLACIKF